MVGKKQILLHRKEFAELLGIKEIPRNLIVHHIDGNKLNNDINNLSLMTYTAHNNLHSHIPWNKGKTTKKDKKWAKASEKARISRLNNYLVKFKETYELRKKGKKLQEIADLLSISRRQVSDRLNKYQNIINN